MKKFYTALLCFTVAGSAFSQSGIQEISSAQVYVSDIDNRLQPSTSALSVQPMQEAAADRGTPFWTEDFANGAASTNGTWTFGGTNGNIWRHSTTNTNGEWSTGTAAFASTTAGNGFMTFDADSANFPLSPNYVTLDGELISPVIDLSSESAVTIEFQQQLRFCCGTQTLNLSVSNDGGSTWTDWDVLGGLAVNAGSANPDLVGVNISAVAANQANVKIKFTYAGNSHYFWSIDDLRLLTPAPNDLVLTSAQYNDFIEYKATPVAQVQPLLFKGYIDNVGSQTQTGVTLTADVENSSNVSVYNSPSSTTLTMNSGTSDSLTVNQYTVTTVDEYVISYNVTQNETEGTPADNLLTIDYAVTDTQYRRDNDASTGGLWNGETGGTSDAYEMGNLYEIPTADFATSVSVVLNNNTDLGVIMYAAIYEYAGGAFNYIDQTNDYTVVAGDINTEITLPFTGTVSLAGGSEYVVVIGHYGGLDALYLGASGTSQPLTTFLLDGTSNTWFYMTNTPMVRLNLFNSAAPSATTSPVAASCFNTCDGSATVTASGGTPPYTYLWSDNQTTATATGLCPGTYTVTVTGANGASNTFDAVVGSPIAMTVAMSSTPPSTGNMDGTATATPSGGIPPYSWLWNDPLSQTTPTASGLDIGLYTCIVTDANGCSLADSVAVGTVGMQEYLNQFQLTVQNELIENNLDFTVYSEGLPVDFVIYDALGKAVYQRTFSATQGQKDISLSTSTWNSGVYILKANFGNEIQRNIKVVKN